MKNIFARLAAVAAVALSLGSCNRAEYATLPASSAYLGSPARAHRAAVAIAPVSQAPAATLAAPVAATATNKPADEPTKAATAVAPTAPLPAAPVAAAQADEARPAAVATAEPTAKSGLMQTLLAKKVLRQADRLTSNLQQRAEHRNTASTAKGGLNSNLKLGIILLVVGAIVTLLPGGIFDLIGAIIAIIGLLFILLAILDMV